MSQALGGWEPQTGGVSGSTNMGGLSGVRVTDDDDFDAFSSSAAPVAIITAPVRLSGSNPADMTGDGRGVAQSQLSVGTTSMQRQLVYGSTDRLQQTNGSTDRLEIGEPREVAWARHVRQGSSGSSVQGLLAVMASQRFQAMAANRNR